MTMKTPSFQLKAYENRLKVSVKFLKQKFGPPPKMALVFGSGLGKEFLERANVKRSIAFKSVPNFSEVTVSGHTGTLHFIQKPTPWIVLQGRSHYYEGWDPEEVVFPHRALALWGVPKILLTNAAGSMARRLTPGSLVWIKDHINLTGANPLRGPNLACLGTRFPSLQTLYQNDFSKGIRAAARRARIKLSGGVYLGIMGPSYETPAEIQAYRCLGGEIIGMSTVFEAIAAAHAGMEVAGLSAITNDCLSTKGDGGHEAVLKRAAEVDKKLSKLLLGLEVG